MSSLYNENGILENQRKRLSLLALLFAVAIFFVLARLFYLQVIRGGYYYSLAASNATRVIYLPAPRGDILSNNGKILVDDESSFNIALTLTHVKDLKNELIFLAKILHKNYHEFYKKVKSEKFLPPYESIIILRNVSIKNLSVFEVNKLFLPGFFIENIPIRHYPYGNIGAQVFGYIGLVSGRQLKEKKYSYINSSDIVGKTGLEYYYQKYLRGKDGEERIVVNSQGTATGKVVIKKPTMGANIYTTIDLPLEKLAYKLMKKKEGAVIAIDPNNGKVLAMVSTPSFNPFYFSRGITGNEWQKIITNKEHPLQNKAVQNAAAPGSTFKVTGALAALTLHLITPGEKIYAGPAFKLGNAVFYNWNPRQHSKVNLYRAIAESVDTYFYPLAVKMNIGVLAGFAHKLGFGGKTGIDLPGENPGFIPTKKLVYKLFHRRWYKGSTLSSIIGQSYVLVTPIQLVSIYSAIANGGYLYRPYIVHKIVSKTGRVLKVVHSKVKKYIGIKKSYIKAVKKGFCDVVNKNYGTAVNARIPGITFCGKTGTAQIISKIYSIYNAKSIPRRERDNAWFVGYAPSRNPETAVVVFDMHAKFLGAHAAVIAKKIVEKYLEQKGLWKPPLIKKRVHKKEKLPSFIYTRF